MRLPTPVGQHRRRWSASLDRATAPARGRTAGTVASPLPSARPGVAHRSGDSPVGRRRLVRAMPSHTWRRLSRVHGVSEVVRRARILTVARPPAYTTGVIARPHRPWTLIGPLDAQTRPQVLAKPRRRGFAQAPTALIYVWDPKTGTDRPTRLAPPAPCVRRQQHSHCAVCAADSSPAESEPNHQGDREST